MDIFQLNETSKTPALKLTKQEAVWVDLGVQYYIAKQNGTSAKVFAQQQGLTYSTFVRNLTRFKSKIQLAYDAHIASKKPKNKLTKRDREAILINSLRSSIRQKIKNDGAAINNKSEKWFKETLAKGVRGHSVVKPSLGKLYAFIYDAKHKDTLPIWDKYPLIIFLGFTNSKKSNTLLMNGLNLHYIPPRARQQFLEDLLKQYSSTPVISNSTQLKIDWSKVKGFSGADKMIKSYLPPHVKGRFVEIKPADWANVITMPLQQFVTQGKRASAKSVWK